MRGSSLSVSLIVGAWLVVEVSLIVGAWLIVEVSLIVGAWLVVECVSDCWCVARR